MYMYMILILIIYKYIYIYIYRPTELCKCNRVLLHVIYYKFLSLHVFLNV